MEKISFIILFCTVLIFRNQDNHLTFYTMQAAEMIVAIVEHSPQLFDS